MDLRSNLDEAHRRVYDAIPPGMVDLSDLAEARRRIEERREAMAPEPIADGVIIEDHEINSFDGTPLLVRTYRPEGPALSSAGRGCLSWIHGGGLVLGDVPSGDARCAQIAATCDVLVTSVEYRLAPEHSYPAPVEDCYAALVWAHGAAVDLGIDPTRIAVGGASAGGGLAAAVALLARDRGEVDLAFQFLVYPMLDDRNETASSHDIVDDRVWNREANMIGWNAYLGGRAGADDIDSYAAPARAEDLSGLPPAYVNVGTLDLFLDENITYARRLLAAGVPAELHVYPGAFHGSNNLVSRSALSRRWDADELAAITRAIGDTAGAAATTSRPPTD